MPVPHPHEKDLHEYRLFPMEAGNTPIAFNTFSINGEIFIISRNYELLEILKSKWRPDFFKKI